MLISEVSTQTDKHAEINSDAKALQMLIIDIVGHLCPCIADAKTCRRLSQPEKQVCSANPCNRVCEYKEIFQCRPAATGISSQNHADLQFTSLI